MPDHPSTDGAQREQLHYGWRPDAQKDWQHVILPGAHTDHHGRHTVALASCRRAYAYTSAGPAHLDWTTWPRCIPCLPGWDRYTLLAGLSDAYPAGLTTIALAGVVPISTPIKHTLGQLITAQKVTTTSDSAGTVLYHLTPAEAAVWASAGREQAGIDLARLNLHQRVGFHCVHCDQPVDLLTRVYVTSAGQPQRHLYRCPDCPRGGEGDG